MQSAWHGQIVSFIWRIADDVLRNVFVRGKYRDVILPMTLTRRLDAVLEPKREAVQDARNRAGELGSGSVRIFTRQPRGRYLRGRL